MQALKSLGKTMQSARPAVKLATQLLVKLAVGLVVLASSYQAIAWFSGLPSVNSVLRGLTSLWISGTLQHDVAVSMARWILGWSIGALFGVSLGVLTGRSRAAGYGLEGFLVLCRAIPFISLVPLSIRIFSLSERGKIFLIAWATMGVCWIIVHQASRSIPKHLVWRATSLGLPWRLWFFRVLLPSISNGIHSALRTSLSLGLIVVAVAELSGVYERSPGYWWSEGLGYRLFRSLDQARDDLLLGSILAFALLGIAVDILFLVFWWSVRAGRYKLRKFRVNQLVRKHKAVLSELRIALRQPAGVEAINMSAAYDGHQVIRDLSFSIPAGKTLVVVGPSGCGKTTLIRALGHFTDEAFKLTEEIVIGGSAINGPGQEMGIVLQEAPVFEHLTVWDNVLMGSRLRSMNRAEKYRIAVTVLKDFGLLGLASQRAEKLSGGQRQRVALATALGNAPKLLLLDEPFGALDAITRRRLQGFYTRHISGKITAVFVTHDIYEAIIVGDIVRVGVDSKAPVFEIVRKGLAPDEWEQHADFDSLRNKIIRALEEASPGTDETSEAGTDLSVVSK